MLKRISILTIALAAALAVGQVAEAGESNHAQAEKEIISERTYNQKVYDLGNGKKRYKVYAGHIHYKENNEFKDIDLHLHKTDGGWIMDKHSYHIFIPEYADEIFDFYNAYEGADHHVKERPIANHVRGEPNYSEKYVIYKDAFGQGIHFKPQIEKFGIRKLIQIDKKPDKDLVFDFEIITDEDTQYLKLGLEGDKELKIEDEVIDLTGKTFRFGKDKFTYVKEARVWDGSNSPKREDVKLALFRKDDKLILRKTISKEFFDDVVFPVYTDHPDAYYGDIADGYVELTGAAGGSWSSVRDASDGDTSSDSDAYCNTSMYVDAALTGPPLWQTAYIVSRAFFYFDTFGIGADATITACDLKIYGYLNANTSVSAQKGTQTDSLTTADYDAFSGSEYGNVAWAIDTYNTISFNAQGISDIEKTGTTKICVREYTYDYLNSEPTANYLNGCYFADDLGSNGDNRDPYLDITVEASAGPVTGAVIVVQ